MVSAWNRAAANPMVAKSLMGILGAGLLVFAVFQQPWVPIEISAPETGVLVAMPSPLLGAGPSEASSSPEANQPIDVPIATPTDAIPSAPVVQTTEVTEVPIPKSRLIPTYSEHIAPLLNTHCVACHRDHDATLRLTESSQVIAHASQIAEATRARQMPPWKPEPGFGHFRNERRLTEQEIELIQDWVNAGAPLGDLAAILSGSPQSEWVLGKPTVAYKLPKPFRVPASEEGVTWSFVIPTGVERELYLTGAELKPGNKALVKRMTLSFDPTGAADEKDKQTPETGFATEASERPVPSIVLAEWLPGMMASPLPEGTGYRIPQGADLVLTVDYAASPISAPDPWQMGLHITRTAPQSRLGRIEMAGRSKPSAPLVIVDPPLPVIANPEPTTLNTARSNAYRVPTTAILYSIKPQLNQTDQQMRVVVEDPSGHVRRLLHIAKWHPKLQERYDFQEPITVTKDSTIHVKTWGNDPIAAQECRCEFEVSTPNPAHLEPLMRHNEAANLQP